MPENIKIRASEVWDYFHKYQSEFEDKMEQIAARVDYGVDIFLTSDHGFPNIVVMHDDLNVYEETIYGKKYCANAVSDIYDRFLTGNAFSELAGVDTQQKSTDDSDNASVLEEQDAIAESEAYLDEAVLEFLTAVLDTANLNLCDDEIIEDVKDHFLEYLFRKHRLGIFRPMFLDYGNGDVRLEEYPYENMVFSDENNPIYKK